MYILANVDQGRRLGTGAMRFTLGQYKVHSSNGSNYWNDGLLTFNASTYNEIYKDNSDVIPNTLKTNMIIKY